MIIGGSKKYHGAPWFSIMAASHFIDLVFFNSVPENSKLISEVKSKTAQFSFISDKELNKYIREVDAVLMGPGLNINQAVKKKVNNILKNFPNKKFVLDADALNVLDKKNIKNKKIILTPHRKEFQRLFNLDANQANVHKMCKKYGIIIVLKGLKDIVCDKKTCYYNSVGNQGQTKGGTGDVLAGIIAAFSCKSDQLLSAQAGTLLIGLAANDLKKTHGFNFNATELANQLPLSLKKHSS